MSTISAPEIPRRSNSIISMTSHNSNFNQSDHNHKPLVSPRHIHSTVSPKILDSLVEDLRSMEVHQSPDPVSPSTFTKPRTSIHHNSKFNDFTERYSPSYNPSSPRITQQEFNDSNGTLPISPHVNVHPNAINFNNHNHKPPPIPPRKKNPMEINQSQMRQAKDAPPLQPRDKSPPPLPPKLFHQRNNNNNQNNNNTNENWNLVSYNLMRIVQILI
jgi:son of sevenless